VTIAEKESIAQESEEVLRKKGLEAEERRKQSHDLVAESIRRELAESNTYFWFYDVFFDFLPFRRKGGGNPRR
jgi:microfibrillar-associated protein 1